ncbi:MAG TPA: radical SAM protein [Deltaproteobacteria bacterium]|nr:radical SAM protein [Deltaproteobacteria bacterium]
MNKAARHQLATRLALNGAYFRYLKFMGKPGTPEAISLEITHDCIAKCVMCNIWKIPHDVPSLSVDQWLQILALPLFSNLRELDITGGEPYLVEDLPDLFEGICALKHKNLKSLQSIAITTNGILTRQVLAYTEAILRSLKAGNIELVVACAVDAIGPVHDKVRCVKNAWSKVDATIQRLKKLRAKHANFILGLKTTILPLNIDELDKIVDYADANDLFTIISPYIITKGRYLNPDRADDLAFDRQHIEKMLRFYRKGRLGWNYHSDQMIRFLETGTVKKPCTCGFNYFFVRYNGTLFLCPLIDIPIGNVMESTLEGLLSYRKASQVRRRIGQYPECRRCTEPGLERFSLPYEGWTYLTVLMKMGSESFLRMHHHMGLDKYF